MTDAASAGVAGRRLRVQRLVGPRFDRPIEAVRSLLAVQSQDYPGAKWALAQRSPHGTTDADLDALFDSGAIVRTHVMRPTWHFVAAEDLRWLQALTAARVHQVSGYQYRLLGIDADVKRKSRASIERALAGGRSMTRDELARALDEDGALGDRGRLGYLLIDAELEAIICSGPRRGRQHTYALVEERVPPSRARERDEALIELATRYVRGHGPAQDIDLSWWSGLTLREARLAFEAAGPSLRREQVDGRTFWADADEAPATEPATEPTTAPAVHLLPNYDELLIAFRDRSDAMDPGLPPPARVAAEILAHVIVRDGLGVGGWKRRELGGSVGVELSPLVPLGERERATLREQAERLAAFLGRPVEVSGLD